MNSKQIVDMINNIPDSIRDKVVDKIRVDKNVVNNVIKGLGEAVEEDTDWVASIQDLLDVDGDGEIMDDIPTILGFFGLGSSSKKKKKTKK